MRKGWLCPRCQRVNAPDVKQCECKSEGYSYEEIMRKFFPNIPKEKWYPESEIETDTTASTTIVVAGIPGEIERDAAGIYRVKASQSRKEP